MAETNVLGLDKFQTTMIKRNYGFIKPIVAKRDKVQKKIDDKQKELDELKANLEAEINNYNEQINALDKFTLETTERFCGTKLTSEQVMYYLEHPEEYKKESSTENPDLDAEEDKDWEDKIASGELKKVTYNENQD